MACRLSGANPLPEPMLQNCQFSTWEQNLEKFESKYKTFHSWKCAWNCRLRNGGHFVQGGDKLTQCWCHDSTTIITVNAQNRCTYRIDYKMWKWCSIAQPLKRKCHHFDEIFVTGCTESCHFDNFRCSQWWKFHQNDDIFVSVNWMNTARGYSSQRIYGFKIY